MSLKSIINGIDVGRQRAVAGSLSDRAEISTSTEWLGGTQTRTAISAAADAEPARDHAVDSDYPHRLFGSATAPSPVELLFAAIGSSFATSFVIAAAIADVRVESLRVHAAARIGANGPLGGVYGESMLASCQLAIEVHANASTAVLERISTLALEGCAVLALCRMDVHVQMQFKDNGVRHKAAARAHQSAERREV